MALKIFKSTLARRLFTLLFFVLMLDQTMGWTLRHILSKTLALVENPSNFRHNFEPGAGLFELPEVNFPRRSKVAIEGLREVAAPDFTLDASFVRDEKMPPNLLHQRLVEGAWPIRIRTESKYRVFYIRDNVVPSEGVRNNRGGQVSGLEFSNPKDCQKLWLKDEVLIADCHP